MFEDGRVLHMIVWNQSCACISPLFNQLVPKKGKGNVFANMLLLPSKLTCFKDTNRILRGRVVLSPGIAAVSIQIQKKCGPLHSLQIKSFPGLQITSENYHWDTKYLNFKTLTITKTQVKQKKINI